MKVRTGGTSYAPKSDLFVHVWDIPWKPGVKLHIGLFNNRDKLNADAKFAVPTPPWEPGVCWHVLAGQIDQEKPFGDKMFVEAQYGTDPPVYWTFKYSPI